MFQRTTASVMPSWTYGLLSLGSPRPMTFTSVRRDCLTASAAPGTAGEQMAMISFTFGIGVQDRVRLVERLSCLSSQGRRAAILISGYFSARRASMCFCHSIMLAAVSEAVMMANSPLPPRMRAGMVHQSVVPMPSRRGLVDEEVAGVGLGVGVPGDDLDPALAGLAEDRRDAVAVLDGHGDHIHAARDPGVDDLVLLGRVGVGRPVPDQLRRRAPCAASSAPLRQAMK